MREARSKNNTWKKNIKECLAVIDPPMDATYSTRCGLHKPKIRMIVGKTMANIKKWAKKGGTLNGRKKKCLMKRTWRMSKRTMIE